MEGRNTTAKIPNPRAGCWQQRSIIVMDGKSIKNGKKPPLETVKFLEKKQNCAMGGVPQ